MRLCSKSHFPTLVEKPTPYEKVDYQFCAIHFYDLPAQL